jgi:hypothetical protein
MTDEPTPTPPAMPTAEDVQAIMERATAAAERAEQAAAVGPAAQSGAADETRERFPGMPDELVARISESAAQQVVAQLRKEFEVAQSQPPAPAAPAEPAEPPSPAVEVKPSLARKLVGGGWE